MRIGLFFGSFNPIHIGHIAIARFMAGSGKVDKVWLIVSPHNPLKDKNSLADSRNRLAQTRKVIGKHRQIKVSNVEFGLPKPSYTIRTLEHLAKKYPKHEFSLIIGSDNLEQLPKWKDYDTILDNYKIYVYPRKGFKGGKLIGHPSVELLRGSKVNVSSTHIRNQMAIGKKVSHLVPRFPKY